MEFQQVMRERFAEVIDDATGRLLALSVGVGLGVLMEAELSEVVGAKYAAIAECTAVRHGREDGEVTLGGRRVAVKRPQARTADGWVWRGQCVLRDHEESVARDQQRRDDEL